MEPLEKLLTVEDLADYLRVPVATIYAWRYHRQGPPGFRVGRHLRYRRADVAEWIERQIGNTGDEQGLLHIGGVVAGYPPGS